MQDDFSSPAHRPARCLARRRGNTLIWCAASMSVMGGIASLTFDVSRLRAAKGELQAAADSAALNAMNGLSDGTYVAKAQAAAGENRCDGTVVSIAAPNVTVGRWTSPTFTANGTPANAVRVSALRTTANGNPVMTTLANLIGRPAADVRATSIATLVGGSDYQWTSVASTTINTSGYGLRLSAYDAKNLLSAETEMTLKSNGSVTLAGKTTLNGNVNYGTSQAVSSPASVSGGSQLAAATPYATAASMVAKAGPVTASYGDQSFYSNVVLGGGVYEVGNISLTACTLAFTGPATVIVNGNLSVTAATFAPYGGLPANLKIIMNGGAGKAVNVANPLAPLIADFYAPDAALNYASSGVTGGLRGRGLFKTMNLAVSGAAEKVYYDRSSRTDVPHAVLVD